MNQTFKSYVRSATIKNRKKKEMPEKKYDSALKNLTKEKLYRMFRGTKSNYPAYSEHDVCKAVGEALENMAYHVNCYDEEQYDAAMKKFNFWRSFHEERGTYDDRAYGER
jgi:hypothetical protein